MIGIALDQAQKLFGRGFLIAAFIPTLIFAVVVSYLLGGAEGLEKTVRGWAQGDLKEMGVEILLSLVAVYLLAYVLYGVRTGLQQLYNGQWPVPLKYLRRVGLAMARRTMVLRQKALREKEGALDDPAWAIYFDFVKTYTPIQVTPEVAKTSLNKIRDSHTSLLCCIEEKQDWQEETYLDILREARILQANRDRFPSDLQMEVDRLVGNIKAAYHSNPTLRSAASLINARARREWTAAYTELRDYYPDDERWLRPTQLGNIASVQELHPFNRYRINLSLLWPRLRHVISDDVRLRLEDTNIYLDFTLIMSFLSFVAAVIAGITAFSGPPRNVPSLLLPLILLGSFWLFYRLAIQAMRSFGTQIQAAVDLFRLKLLDALEIERPANLEEEQKIWEEIRSFIAQADLPQKHVRFKDRTRCAVSSSLIKSNRNHPRRGMKG